MPEPSDQKIDAGTSALLCAQCKAGWATACEQGTDVVLCGACEAALEAVRVAAANDGFQLGL